jgi:hypothetical protein
VGVDAVTDDFRSEPGTATIQRLSDGTRIVTQAHQTIRVSVELLTDPDLEPDVVEPDGTLRLDTEGLYRYRPVRRDGEHWRIYERITDDGGPR